MLSLLIAACILGGALLLGAEVLSLTRLWSEGRRGLPAPERALFALGLGVVLLSYLVLVIGLLGFLRPWVLLALVAGSAIVGVRRVPFLWAAIKQLVAAAWRGVVGRPRRPVLRLFLVIWGVLTLLAALSPPTDLDYDGLSQHLAAPKIHLRHGEIEPIWFDHHSHFPSALQMLFTIALAAGRPEAARAIHWAFGVGAALALVVAGRRFVSPAAGEWGAFALMTVPVMGWLATVAYVDLASVFFAVLLLLGLLRWQSSRAGSDLLLAGLAAGGGMAVKMQGLQIFIVAGLLVLIACVWARTRLALMARQLAIFTVAGVALAAPWYVKTAIWTGNPVYPFAYEVFGGKYWGQKEADQYREHQLEFGVGSPPPPAERKRMSFLARTLSGPRAPLNLLLAPWNVAMHPGEFDVVGMNPWRVIATAAIGPLLLALLPLVVLAAPPAPVRWSLAMFAVMWLGWLLLMQYNRYLLPALAFAALPAGWVVAEMAARSALPRLTIRGVAWACGALAILSLALDGLVLGEWRAGLGLTPRREYLTAHSECYRVSEWVNVLTPPGAKIALYSEPRGFYLDRDYLWADPGHSRLIEYETIESGEDLLKAYGELGITHVLYRRLPGAPRVFEVPGFGIALGELRDEGLISVVGRAPGGGGYILLAVETPWARERGH